MNWIRAFSLASAAAVALAGGSSASAASYLYTFELDAVGSTLGAFAATSITYSADSLDPATLTYVSGNVNGTIAPTLQVATATGARIFSFTAPRFDLPGGSVGDIYMVTDFPVMAGQTYETDVAGRGIRVGSGLSYIYTTGRVRITEQLAAVPEPSTWALLIAGFGLVGGAMRRAPRQTAAVSYA